MVRPSRRIPVVTEAAEDAWPSTGGLGAQDLEALDEVAARIAPTADLGWGRKLLLRVLVAVL
jgi:hypothetical protein